MHNNFLILSLATWFLKNPIAAKFLLVLILVAGILGINKIDIESFPTIPTDTIEIVTPSPGSSPREIERNIIIEIEQALSGVKGIKRIFSTIEDETARIEITKHLSTDIESLFKEISARVSGLTNLQSRQTPTTVSLLKNERSVIWISISGDATQETIGQVAKGLREQLLRQPNITSVEISGLQNSQIAIALSPAKLRQFGISFSDVSTILKSTYGQASLGSINLSNQASNSLTLNLAADIENIGDTVINQGSHNSVLHLHDIATIDQSHITDPTISIYNGKPAIVLFVHSDEDADFMKAYEETQKTTEFYRSTISPSIDLEYWHNDTEEVSNRITYFVKSGLFSMAMVFLLLFMFLEYRFAFWVSLGIPITFSSAIAIMWWMGLSINIVTLFGFIIALGIVVDDGIVVAESIYTSKQNSSNSYYDATIAGVKNVATPATFGVLTTIAAFAPLTAISSDFGQQLGSMAWVVVLCLAFSIVESKLILPHHLAKLTLKDSKNKVCETDTSSQNTKGRDKAGNRIFVRLERLLNFRYPIILAFITLLLMSIYSLNSGAIGRVFFPDLEGSFIEASFSVTDGASINESREKVDRLVNALSTISQKLYNDGVEDAPPVKNIYALVNNKNIQIVGEMQEFHLRNISVNDILDMWRDEHNEENDPEFYNFDSGNGEFYVDLYGSNLDNLSASNANFKQRLKSYAGISNIDSSEDNTQPEIQIATTPEGEARGFHNTHLVEQLRFAFNGENIFEYQSNGEKKDVTLYYGANDRRNLVELKDYVITNSENASSPLSSIADIKFIEEVKLIERVNGERISWLSAGVDKSTITPNEIIFDLTNSEFLDNFKQKYADIRVSFEGEYEQENSATKSFFIASLISLLTIYTLLTMALNSLTKPLLILSIIPFGFVGVIFGHLIMDIPISILSYFGLLALSGVVVNDCLLLLSTASTSSEECPKKSILNAIVSRFRAVALTSATTFICLIPIMFSTAYQTQLFVPTAVSLGFGILFSTFTTLLYLPSLCLIIEDIKTLIHSRVSLKNK